MNPDMYRHFRESSVLGCIRPNENGGFPKYQVCKTCPNFEYLGIVVYGDIKKKQWTCKIDVPAHRFLDCPTGVDV